MLLQQQQKQLESSPGSFIQNENYKTISLSSKLFWFSKFLFHSKARLCYMLKFERKETVKGFVKAEDFRNNNPLKVQDFKNIYFGTILCQELFSHLAVILSIFFFILKVCILTHFIFNS